MGDKLPDKEYFKIGEVSKLLDVDPYVVRYWESEFKSVKPVRTKSDQRLYRRKDVEELSLIKNLLYTEKFTIQGAKKALVKLKKEQTDSFSQQQKDKLLMEIKSRLIEIRKILS